MIQWWIRYHPNVTFDPIIFVVDTGCTETCLLCDDVVRLQISWQGLQNSPRTAQTANGPVVGKFLPNVDILLPSRSGLFYRKSDFAVAKYPNLEIIPPNNQNHPVRHPQQCIS